MLGVRQVSCLQSRVQKKRCSADLPYSSQSPLITNLRAQMFLRPHQRSEDEKDHTYWTLVETVRTVGSPGQRMLCYVGELNGSAQARWRKSVEGFNEQAEALQSADIVLPTTDGGEIRLRRIIEPTTEQKSLLRRLSLSLPERLKSLSNVVQTSQ